MFLGLKGLPSCKALVGAVPVADLLLAELPAQEHDFVPPDRREVEQARRDVPQDDVLGSVGVPGTGFDDRSTRCRRSTVVRV